MKLKFIRTWVAVTLLCLSGCVGYNGAVERQLDKENAAIAAQVATNEVPR